MGGNGKHKGTAAIMLGNESPASMIRDPLALSKQPSLAGAVDNRSNEDNGGEGEGRGGG